MSENMKPSAYSQTYFQLSGQEGQHLADQLYFSRIFERINYPMPYDCPDTCYLQLCSGQRTQKQNKLNVLQAIVFWIQSYKHLYKYKISTDKNEK